MIAAYDPPTRGGGDRRNPAPGSAGKNTTETDMTIPTRTRFGAPAFLRALALSVLGFASLAAPVQAQDYPTRPVELIVYVQPGGGTDTMARAFADAARRHFPQPFLVVNKPGVGHFGEGDGPGRTATRSGW
jgi:hypothetical protein